MSTLPGYFAAQFILQSSLPDYPQGTEISWYPVILRNKLSCKKKKLV